MATITRTPRQLITSALKALGVMGQSDDLENEQATDGLNALNEYLASISTERGMIYALDKQSYTLSAGTGSYSIGSGGDFDTDRPIAIGEHGYLSTGGVDYPLRCFTRKEYNWIENKSTQDRPSELYYDPDYPLGKIYFNYTPDQAYTLKIDVHAPIGSISTLDTTIVLPPEYAALIKWNLAEWIAPDYEIDVYKEKRNIHELAKQARRRIMNNNAEVNPVDFDAGLVPAGAIRARTITSG